MKYKINNKKSEIKNFYSFQNTMTWCSFLSNLW